MVSATESIANPQTQMAEHDRKTFKKFLKVFFKKDKKKEKHEPEEIAEKPVAAEKPSIAAQAIENVLQNIQKLNIKDETEKNELSNFTFKTVEIQDKEVDEFENFTFKTVKDEGRNDRSDSHSSEDSGFADKLDEVASDDDRDKDEVLEALEKLTIDKQDDGKSKEKRVHTPESRTEFREKDEVTEALEKLSIAKEDDEKSKDKKVQTVVVARQPIRNKDVKDHKNAPYYIQQTDVCRQIQINKHTLTGGEVIVQPCRSNDFLEVDTALKQVQQTSQHSQYENQDEWFNIVTEVIQDDVQDKAPSIPNLLRKMDAAETSVEDFLSDFFQSQEVQQDFYQTPVQEMIQQPMMLTPPHQGTEMPQMTENPIEQFSNHLNYELFGEIDLVTSLNAFVDSEYNQSQFVFPTPPHSENAASPMSDSQGSFNTYSPGRSVILSPERSSPICNSDYEKFQDIANFEESSVSEDEKKRERNNSTSSMTMKQYKDLQKKISDSFSKKDCCQLTRAPCKQTFQEHLQKLPVEERRNICLKVAKMDLKHAYGVLQNIMRSLSQSSSQEDLQYALFCLVCERVLSQTPAWYVEDFGLNLLKSAALRCPSRPLLTRYLVQCVRTAIRIDPTTVQGKDSVFHEVDALGDTLLTAMARRGDSCADALAEIVRRDPDDLPLFKVHHVNADGASALHVACIEHSASSPRLHVTHVLLEHGGADLWQGDAKAGDTPVHMAVNSRTCDLHLVMVLFKHVDRKVWKKLAHVPNLCSTTPLEYARSATKSQIRDGYPSEVLEFLKKCR